MKGRLLYSEEQSFIYSWMWWLLMVVAIPNFGVFGYGFYQQIILGEPWGDNPISDSTMIVVDCFTFLILGAIIWLFQVMKLIIKVDQSTISYSFVPFVSETKTVNQQDLKDLFVRKYSPIFEYGGWGYRFLNHKDQAYNVVGRWGLQLVFKDGRKLLLGTQKPKEFEEAITKLKKNWGMND